MLSAWSRELGFHPTCTLDFGLVSDHGFGSRLSLRSCFPFFIGLLSAEGGLEALSLHLHRLT